MKRLMLISVALVGIAGCTWQPTEPGWTRRQEQLYAWELLDVYFIFRDRMPDDPFAFSSPAIMYRHLNEPYTVYMNKIEAELFLANLTTEQGGLGIRIDSTGSGYYVKDVFDNSPASRAGIRTADTITAVGGASVVGKNYEYTGSLLAGLVGETRTLTLRRGGGTLSVTVTLGTFLAPTVFVDSVDSQVATITLTAFLQQTEKEGGTAVEFDSALEATAWAKHTVIDLRSNPGGIVEQCITIIGHFVPESTQVIQARERAYNEQGDSGFTDTTIWKTGEAGAWQTRGFSLLMDSLSASASEVMIYALRRARPDIKTIGTRSFGKARGQTLFPTPDSALAKITYALLEPADGESYDSIGIEPDIVLTDPGTALDEAVARFHGDSTGVSAAKRRVSRGRFRRWREERERLTKDREPMAVKNPGR